jgi:hypothetical protein
MIWLSSIQSCWISYNTPASHRIVMAWQANASVERHDHCGDGSAKSVIVLGGQQHLDRLPHDDIVHAACVMESFGGFVDILQDSAHGDL